MSNSIDKNDIGIDNSMSILTFYWIAYFKDGSILKQFDNGKENKFKDVLDKKNQLIKFSLVKNDSSQLFEVDLVKGKIIYNKCELESENKEKNNIRLIYFRRNIINFDYNFDELNRNIIYFLGFQYLDKNNKNCKVFLKIDKNGNFIIEG